MGLKGHIRYVVSIMTRFFFVLILTLLLCAPARSDDMRVYTELAGNAVFKKGHKIGGGDVNLVRELMKRVGTDAEIEVVPWQRGYEAVLNESNVALFPTTLTKERESRFYWVGPLFRLKWVFWARKGHGAKINSLEDARRVGSIGTYYKDARERFLLSRGFTNLKSANNNIVNYRKLAEGRLDLVLSSNIGLQVSAELAGVSPDSFEQAFVVREVDLYLAISKSTKPAIVKIWKKAFQSMLDDGTFQRIYREWQPLEIPPVVPLPVQ